jgi:4-hydroxybenzoate polyprenyltransferase
MAVAFLGAAAAGGALTTKLWVAVIIIIAWNIHANAVNDYADRHIDAVNLSGAADRPLVTGDISHRRLWVLSSVSGLLALALSAVYGPTVVGLSAAIIIIDFIYSVPPLRLTNHTLISPVLLAAAYTVFPLTLGYWSATRDQPYPWLLAIGVFLGFVARMLLKDFRDVKGDRQYGKITFVLRYGTRATCLASGLCWLGAMVAVAVAVRFAPGVIIPLTLGLILVVEQLRRLATASNIPAQQTVIVGIAKIANATIITLMAYLLCLRQGALTPAELQLIPATLGLGLMLPNWPRRSADITRHPYPSR